MRTAKRHRASPCEPSASEQPLRHPDWSQLLVDAVAQPGVLSAAYSQFWNYSVGNQLLAWAQCVQRRIELGPINTFGGWLALGRHVKKGEKALILCMPVTVKRKAEACHGGDGAERSSADADGKETITVFTYKRHWFVLGQTDGEPYVPQELPAWSERQALHSLLIDRVPFSHANGNCQGYAVGRNVAVSPVAALPHKTLFHELAHVVIGHTEEGNLLDDHDRTPRDLREVEAESVALICCESLNLPGDAECRGYIQHWLGEQKICDRTVQRIFKAADTILKAGRPASTAGCERRA